MSRTPISDAAVAGRRAADEVTRQWWGGLRTRFEDRERQHVLQEHQDEHFALAVLEHARSEEVHALREGVRGGVLCGSKDVPERLVCQDPRAATCVRCLVAEIERLM